MTARARKPSWTRWDDVPDAMVRLASERTAFLLERYPLDSLPLPRALANAYLQGMQDAAEVAAGMLARDFEPKSPEIPDGLA